MGRYVLEVEGAFSSAHNLRNYGGKCEELHGHNWRVKVFVGGDELDDIGILIDFKVLKTKLREILSRIDHVYLNEIEPFDTINPSSENIAKYIFERLSESLKDYRVRVERVTVYESDGAGASYIGDA